MIFSIKTLVPLLLAGTAIASPATIPAARRFRGGSDASFANFTSSADEASAATLGTYTFTNWAGAFLRNTAVTSVTGTFVIPKPSMPAGGNSGTSYCGCAWVGLDGISNFCPNGGLIQAGVNWCVENGVTSFAAWHEWWPAEAMQYWDNVSVSAGDSITVTITASNTEAGSATLINNTTGQRVRFVWTYKTPSLCEATAEWIVEDYSIGNNLVAFADYGSVTFTGNSAVIHGATTSDLSNSYIANMVSVSNPSQVISASTVNGNAITVVYQ
ncbi:hypothetical protein TMatcc_004431 [Talaromyces marneffei ATCC 18224]|uniref:Aspergillopepsin-2, putative n=2 Tax=Talaromyces marneffei TaxID=37727 RepID=B6Q4M0_TALMQ|nr:uncharacterized protein EYB26_000621 [Talaromyces marneffei]EEA27279.1 aspergillopepsin-2 precursor, putative [Talaromyces marneffei ATCC 18224]KAE8557007.1 hypothetical protein EYB25_001713 [Talaromyces marneffei]QGA12976.1 hypothetical protein EYB26_000621 [Talaromyces marneffei]